MGGPAKAHLNLQDCSIRCCGGELSGEHGSRHHQYADQKIDEAAHLGKVLVDLQAHCDHLRQSQQLASQELASTRAALTEAAARGAQRDETILRLEAELLALKSSPSWRWTAWLRARGGKSGGKP